MYVPSLYNIVKQFIFVSLYFTNNCYLVKPFKSNMVSFEIVTGAVANPHFQFKL